jgi:uncharacterized protein (TIGR00297 family)
MHQPFPTLMRKSVPAISVFILLIVVALLLSMFQIGSFIFISSAFLFMGIGSLILYRMKTLTANGSIAAWSVGVFLIIGPGIEWLIPVLLFFITSVFFTKLRSRITGKKKEKIARNAWQVAANIIWAMAAALLYQISGDDIYMYLFIVYVAAVTADTWASELGPIFNKRSFSVADMRMHEAGHTGGISFGGTLAALAGAAFISLMSLIILPGPVNLILVALTLAAFLACFSDTFLGAFVEEKLYKHSFFNRNTDRERITPNDIVNIGGSFTAGIFYLLILHLF